jgi:hypothetical protein
MAQKVIKMPDSDRSARKPVEEIEDEIAAPAGELAERQTSVKTGKHSSVEKQAASRPELAPRRKPVAGAHGKPEKSVATLPAPKKKRKTS